MNISEVIILLPSTHEFLYCQKWIRSSVLITDIQTPPPPPLPLKNSLIYMKDAQCAETNERYIFLFMFIDLWTILYSTFLENWPKYHHKRPKVAKKCCPSKVAAITKKYAQCAETNEKSVFRLLFFKLLSIFYSKFQVNLELGRMCFRFEKTSVSLRTSLRTWFRNANQWYPITNWLGGFNPWAPRVWGRSQRG